MKTLGFTVAVLVLGCALSFRTAGAQISVGYPWTAAETCADAAMQLGDISHYDAQALGSHVRREVPGWRLYKGTEKELAAAFLAKSPCLRKTVPADRCPDVQKLVDETTVGDSLGAKLRLIFPEQTADMRDKYAAQLIKVYCPQLSLGPAATPSSTDVRDTTIMVFVEAPVEVDGFVPPSMIGTRDAAKSISSEVFKQRDRSVVGLARNKSAADVVVSVIRQESQQGTYRLHATLALQGLTFDFEATDKSRDAAAKQLGRKIYDWLAENRDRIVRGRKGQ